MREAMVLHPVMQPVTDPLPAWTEFKMAPLAHHRDAFGVTFVRAVHNETQAAVKAAIKSGQMKPALDAVNTLQSVAWRINTKVLDVMRECIERKIDVPGLPSAHDLPRPSLPLDWDQLDDKAKQFWKWRVSEVKKRNRTFNADRLLLTEDMTTVERLESSERFYTPMNCDWRGRVYGLCHFNFQREDRVRALFEFADGEAIGEEGLWWLKVHVANCGDFDKISKRPMKERVEWVDRTRLHPVCALTRRESQ
jgi:DNA-directed RNA polymerase